jgi:hypothetical protein
MNARARLVGPTKGPLGSHKVTLPFPDDEDRAGRMAHDSFRCAPQKGVRDGASAMRRDDNQV